MQPFQMAARRRNAARRPPTSLSVDEFSVELDFAGDRTDLVRRIERLWRHLDTLGLDDDDRKLIEIGRAAKKNFAQSFSTAIAQKTADALRSDFPGIRPDQDGAGQESLSVGSRGLKKLDVNYSTTRSGLELAVSIKTINFKDERTGRYTKNARRVDGELRAEAQDCHGRQPYAVLAAYVFLPIDAASDGHGSVSSMKHIAEILSKRTGRVGTGDDASLFELAFIALYDESGRVVLFCVDSEVPERGVPSDTLTFEGSLALLRRLHNERNRR